MAITRLKVSNFKSFDHLEVELRPLNIVVGSNAAGKSNFLEIFRFLRDWALEGPENAVSLQGGMEYLANLQIGSTRSLSLEATLDSPRKLIPKVGWAANCRASTYSLDLTAAPSSPGFEILTERVLHECDSIRKEIFGIPELGEDLGSGQIRIVRENSKVGTTLVIGSGMLQELADPLGREDRLSLRPTESLLKRGLVLGSNLPIDLSIFDLDPKLPKKAAPVSGRADLEPDGSNLALVFRNLLKDPGNRADFLRLLQDALPFIEDLKVERFADKSLLVAIKERFPSRDFLPASFLSDGTIHLATLIVALYFHPASIVIIEEPERNIHPHLISKVVRMLADASQKKQIIVTTHNPELVKHAALEDLLLVTRDEKGFSHVTRPAESAELKVFLENDLGVDELYVQNLLGVGHDI